MYSNSELLQAYVCNVVSTVLTDRSNVPFSTKIARAAISSIPQLVTVNTTPFVNMVVNHTTLKQDPPSIQYEDALEMVNEWKGATLSIGELPKMIETGLKVGDLIKK